MEKEEISTGIVLSRARSAARAAHAKASAMGLAVAVAIVDAGGRTVLIERGDGAGFLTPETALRKALAAAAFREDTARLEEKLATSNFWKLAPTVLNGSVLPTKGGMPLSLDDAGPPGGLGISGGSGVQDYEIAKAVIEFMHLQRSVVSPADSPS